MLIYQIPISNIFIYSVSEPKGLQPAHRGTQGGAHKESQADDEVCADPTEARNPDRRGKADL